MGRKRQVTSQAIVGDLMLAPMVAAMRMPMLAAEAQRLYPWRTESMRAVMEKIAATGEGIDSLLAAISQAFDEEKSERTLTLSFAEGRKRAWLHERGVRWFPLVGWAARPARRFRRTCAAAVRRLSSPSRRRRQCGPSLHSARS